MILLSREIVLIVLCYMTEFTCKVATQGDLRLDQEQEEDRHAHAQSWPIRKTVQGLVDSYATSVEDQGRVA